MQETEIFDRAARRVQQNRILRSEPEDRWLLTRMAEEVLQRWQDVQAPAKRILILGHTDDALLSGLEASCPKIMVASPSLKDPVGWGAVQCDEDRLPFADRAFDAVIAIGTLDSVNDLPGALLLIRRTLVPGGHFMGAFLGAGTLERTRALMRAAQIEGVSIARTHPQIEVRAAGDLLVRAGFTHAVADADEIEARYSTIDSLFRDLRANGLTNCLTSRKPMSRPELAKLASSFNDDADKHHRVSEFFCPIFLSARAPA